MHTIPANRNQRALVTMSCPIIMILVQRMINIILLTAIVFVAVHSMQHYFNTDRSIPVITNNTVDIRSLSEYVSPNVSFCASNESLCRNRTSVNTFTGKFERALLSKIIHRRVSPDKEKQGNHPQNNAILHIVLISDEIELGHDEDVYHEAVRRNDQNIHHYGSWSKWSPCNRSCMTQRRSRCSNPDICDRNIIRENAFCYVDGSSCQKFIHRRIRSHRRHKKKNIVYNTKPNIIGNVDNYYIHKNWKCGFGSGKRDRVKYPLRIIGGHPSNSGDWPWQVALLNDFQEVFCGGTLISPKWVITAAHCVRNHLYVRLGEYDLTRIEGTEIEMKVDAVMIHPNYNARTVDNDVALLRLPITSNPSSLNGVACLPTAGQSLPTHQLCTIIGWGKLNDSDYFGTDVLHETRIPIVPTNICRDMYDDYIITDNMFCAGFRWGRMDSCAGDSGGPLLCRDTFKPHEPWTIYGVTSFGEGCGKRGKFGIYTKLTNYVNWIARVMNE